jgi:glucosamine--fructose-6-phosphate aminotransferase (isomerizing)
VRHRVPRGVVGRYIIEEWARIPVEPDIASEWRYRNPVLSKDTLVIGISSRARPPTRSPRCGSRASRARARFAITNQLGTQITREVDSVLYTRAGLEIGVAATKTFTAQSRAAVADRVEARAGAAHAARRPRSSSSSRSCTTCPERMEHFLDGDHPIDEIAERHYQKPFFLYLGRHIGLPVALEGALKLKEISYIPTRATRRAR